MWVLNEWIKRYWERHKRKEERYLKLLQSMEGFYVSTSTKVAKSEKDIFLRELRYGWLYLPDRVILKAHEFLDAVHTGSSATDDTKELLLGELVALMREDLLGKTLLLWKTTKLVGKDYRHFKGN